MKASVSASRNGVALLRTPATWAALVALGLSIFAYRELLGLSTRVGFAQGVEYWLFRPSDSVPIVVLSISVWLLYRRSHRFASLSFADGNLLLAIPLFALSGALYAWAVYTGSLDQRVFSFCAFLFATLAALVGTPGLRALWVPAAFVLFAIQLPAPLMLVVVYKLQLWTAEYAGLLLYWIGETALVSGDQIIRAHQKFQVVEGCSGLRSLETMTMLTVLMADLFGRRKWHAFILILCAPFVAFALNGVRVLTLILNPHSDIVTIHNMQGIAVLLMGLLLLYGLDELLGRILPEAASPHFESTPRTQGTGTRQSIVGVTAVACMALVLGAVSILGPVWEVPIETGPNVHTHLGDSLTDWPSHKTKEDLFFLGSARFDQIFHRTVDLPDVPVDVFVATGSQGELGGSPLSPMTAHPASGYAEIEQFEVTLNEDEPVITARVMRRGKQEMLVYHWFVGRDPLPIEVVRTLFGLPRSPARREQPPFVVRLTTEIVGRGPEARREAGDRLDRVYRKLGPALQVLAGDPHP